MDKSTRNTLIYGAIGLATLGGLFKWIQRRCQSAPCSPVKPVKADIVAVGSANADIYIEVETIPRPGETIDGELTLIGPGGKGSNQAGAAAKTYTSGKVAFIGRVGNDQHRQMFFSEYDRIGLDRSLVATHPTAPTGQAYIMLAADKQNSIIVALGANNCWDTTNVDGQEYVVLSDAERETILGARVVMLQREIPDEVNLAVAKLARAGGVPVMLDMGGKAGQADPNIFPFLSIFALNETELARVAGQPVELNPRVEDDETLYQHLAVKPRFSSVPIISACASLFAQGVEKVLVTLGGDGAMLVDSTGIIAYHPGFPPATLVDTTGAGDCFRGAFSAAFVEGKSWNDCLAFGSAAASISITKKGTLGSMPYRAEVDELLNK